MHELKELLPELRNLLSPFFTVTSLTVESEERSDLKPLIINDSLIANKNKKRIKEILAIFEDRLY